MMMIMIMPAHFHLTNRVPIMLPRLEQVSSTHRMVGMLRSPTADASPGAASQMRAHSAVVTAMISPRK